MKFLKILKTRFLQRTHSANFQAEMTIDKRVLKKLEVKNSGNILTLFLNALLFFQYIFQTRKIICRARLAHFIDGV